MSSGENAKVIELGAHERMTTEGALGLTLRESPPEVIILFHDHAGSFGLRSSGMSRKDALWIIEEARQWVLSGGLTE